MDLGLFALQLMNGLAYSMLLFLVSAGLTLIFGLMDMLNLAHGAFFMIGAYLGLSFLKWTGSFWLALALAPLATAALGYLVERLVIRPVYARGHLDQVLLTLGLAYVLADLARVIWGTDQHGVPAPDLLKGSIPVGDLAFPVYRVFVIVFGLALAAALWYLLERTRLGAVIRAGVSGRAMAQNLGIDIPGVFSHTFAFGIALAGLAGVVSAPILGAAPGLDSEILIPALIVVVIGGLGSLSGSFFGALLVGLAETFGKQLIPQFALFLIFVLMALVLLYRPGGLLGRGQA